MFTVQTPESVREPLERGEGKRTQNDSQGP
jgi:hypothetical protein